MVDVYLLSHPIIPNASLKTNLIHCLRFCFNTVKKRLKNELLSSATISSLVMHNACLCEISIIVWKVKILSTTKLDIKLANAANRLFLNRQV